jgi:hypothetical protein
LKISYVTGDQYCVLLIPRQKAEQLKIANSDEIIIKTTEHGIALEKETASARTLADKNVDSDFTRIQTGESSNVAEF